MMELLEILQRFWPEDADEVSDVSAAENAAAQQALAEALAGFIEDGFVSAAEHQGCRETVLELEARLQSMADELASVEEECARRARQRELEFLAEMALREAGAKNLRAARALLDIEAAAAAEDADEVIGQQVLALRQAAESAFLFGARDVDMGGRWCGFVPAAAGDQEIDMADGGFRLRLDRARAQGDGLSVIRLKQEAAREGVIL